MRTGFSIKLSGVMVVLAAAGLAGYARPEAVPEAPTPRPADPSRLIVGFAGHVRYLTPDGQEVGRLTGDQVKAAGADIHTRRVSVELGRWQVDFPVTEIFAPAGRAAPDGRLPVDTQKGLYLLAAGPPATVTPVKAKGGDKALFAGKDVPQIAAWSADGTKAIGWRSEERLFGPNKNVNTLIDLTAGTAEPLKVPPGHRVMDWSPDGSWFLTLRAEESFSFRNGGWSVRVTLCRVSADGTSVESLADPREFVWYAAISPDGTKVAYGRGTTGPVEARPGEKPMELFNGFEVVVLDLATMTRTVVFASEKVTAIDTGELAVGVRWSPDGTRLAVASWVAGETKWARRTRVRVCDADGGNARVVLETDRTTAEAFPTVFDWR